MKHFKKIRDSIDLTAVLDELASQTDAWAEDTSRQTKVKCQRETETIFLRSVAKPVPAGVNANDVHPSRLTRMAKRFPKALELCEAIAAGENGRLARATIVKLLPNGRVYPHIDHGNYYRIRDRYHLVLVSQAGSPLITGEETAVLQTGELWVFDNKVRHEARNTSSAPRIHLIFDIEPAPGEGHYIYPEIEPAARASAA